jgi:hypothetical protein
MECVRAGVQIAAVSRRCRILPQSKIKLSIVANTAKENIK